MKSPGQIAYEQDLALRPEYQDGTPRRPWDELSNVIQWSWERDPRPRHWAPIDESDEVDNEWSDA